MCIVLWTDFSCVIIFTRFLDPDPPSLLAEVGKSMSKKYHQLNKAITTLVSAKLNAHDIQEYLTGQTLGGGGNTF